MDTVCFRFHKIFCANKQCCHNENKVGCQCETDWCGKWSDFVQLYPMIPLYLAQYVFKYKLIILEGVIIKNRKAMNFDAP